MLRTNIHQDTQPVAYTPPLHAPSAMPFFARLFSLGLAVFGLSSLFGDIDSRLLVGSSTDRSSPTPAKNSKTYGHVAPLVPDLLGDGSASGPSINTSTAPEMTISHGSWNQRATTGDSGFWEDESAWEDEIEEPEDEVTMTWERFNRILHKHEVCR